VTVTVVAERVQYYGPDGLLITESLKDYTRKNVTKQYATMDAFLNSWTKADQKMAVVRELEEQGVIFEALEGEVGKDFDPFDLICHVVYGQPPLSRKERAEKVRRTTYFSKYGEKARAVLDAILTKYADKGIEEIESLEILKVDPISRIGTPLEIVQDIFGGKSNYLTAIHRLEQCLYTAEC
jgi:type I restriction enzyme R subunit